MKILFLFYEDPENPTSFPLGVGLLSGILKKLDHTVKGIHVHTELSSVALKNILKQVLEFNPGLIGYSCTSPAFERIKIIAKYLREHTNITTICGGAHPTLYPEDTISVSGIDYICIGEGERSLIEFVNRLGNESKIENIPGIHNNYPPLSPNNDKLYPLEQNLNSLPWTDYNLFGKAYIKEETEDGWLRCISSRGCPYSCSYCHTPMFRKVYAEKTMVPEAQLGYVRFRSVDSLIEELIHISGQYNLKVINFMDDLFCLKKSRTLDFCRKFRKLLPKDVGFSIQTHLQHLDEEIVTALRESRCLRVVVGVETASQRILDLFKRKTSPQAMHNKLKMLVKAKFPLGIWSLNMLGNPQESKAEMLQTLSINSQTMVERIKINIFAPYPNSAIYQYCLDNQLFESSETTQNFKDRQFSRLKFPDEEKAFLEKFFDVGHWYLNLSAQLNLQEYFKPLVKEIEEIGPGEWGKNKIRFMKKEKQIIRLLEKNQKPFYRFAFQGKVYSNVIGLQTFPSKS